MFFHFVLFFSLEKTITKLDLLQFDTLFSFAEYIYYNWIVEIWSMMIYNDLYIIYFIVVDCT